MTFSLVIQENDHNKDQFHIISKYNIQMNDF